MSTYSDIVVDHFENPRNLGEIEGAQLQVRIGDPVCGDTLVITASCDPESQIITDAKFLAFGCAPTLALGSVLTEFLISRSSTHLESLDEADISQLLGGLSPNQQHVSALGIRAVTELRRSWGAQAGKVGAKT